MFSTKRIAATTIGVTGFALLTFVPMTIRSWAATEQLVALAIAGGILLSTGALGIERVRQIEGVYTDRQTEIRLRAGWYAFYFVMAPAWASLGIGLYTERTVSAWAFIIIGPGGLLVYQGIALFLKWER